jgi:tetratricopeptide (TPR) repeat protein
MERTAPQKRLKKFFLSHSTLLPLIVFSLVGILLYANSIHNGFVFDDIQLIINNPSIRDLKNIPRMFGVTGRYFYRPLREISYAIDYQLTGLNPMGYHLFNIFYHILSSYLIFLIAYRLSKDQKVGLIAGLLFIAHPIQTESVAYISGRRDILTGLFFLTGFYSFLKFRESSSKKYLVLIYLSYCLSLLSKEMGVTLPAVALLYDLLVPARKDTELESFSDGFKKFLEMGKETLKRNWLFYVGPFLMAALFTFYKVAIKNPSYQMGYYGGSLASNFLTVIGIWVFYIQKLILPLSLNVAHSFPLSKSLFEFRTLLSLSILIALFILFIYLLKRRPLYSFCGLWFFITLLPVSHIFPHHELLAEHYLYLPSFGFFVAIGLLSIDLLQRERWRPFVYGSFAALFLFYSFQTIQRNLVWKDGLTLWADAARKSPDNPRAKMNLGAALMHRGENDRAMEIFQTLSQTDKNNYVVYNNMGLIYLQRKDFDHAIEAFKKALLVRPGNADAYNDIAMATALKGDLDEAINAAKEAIRIRPGPQYYFNLATFYEEKGMATEAITAYERAIQSNPRFFDAYQNLGMLYSRLELSQQAISVLEKALKINPDSGKTYFMIGVNFLKMKEKEKAVYHLEKALPLATNEKDRKAIQAVLGKLQSHP